MAHFVSVTDLPEGGEHLEGSKVARLRLGLAAAAFVGLAMSAYLFLFAGKDSRDSYAYSWLFGFYYFFSIGVGGLFWVLLHNATNSGWGIAVRRVFENIAGILPVMFVLAIPLLFPQVQNALWEWMAMHREVIGKADGAVDVKQALYQESYNNADFYLLYWKYNYLNMPFWVIRFGLFAFILVGAATLLRRRSLLQDSEGGLQHTFSMRAWACVLLLPFAIAATLFAVDILKTLDYTWFSTMWGVYLFAGSAWSSMTVAIVTVMWLRQTGHLRNVVSDEHLHVMGKLLFAFTVFWAYISFSQFFLIWYANMTEETQFFLLRNTEGWNIASLFLVFGHFAVPFLLLLPAWSKKHPAYMTGVAAWIFIMHALDHYWIVIPERGPSLTAHTGDPQLLIPGAWIGDIIAFITIGAIAAWWFLGLVTKSSLYPCRDPRLQESINLHN